MCLGAILWARIERIHCACLRADATVAGFDDAAFYAEIALPAERRRVPLVVEERERGLAVFRAWLAKTDRREY